MRTTAILRGKSTQVPSIPHTMVDVCVTKPWADFPCPISPQLRQQLRYHIHRRWKRLAESFPKTCSYRSVCGTSGTLLVVEQSTFENRPSGCDVHRRVRTVQQCYGGTFPGLTITSKCWYPSTSIRTVRVYLVLLLIEYIPLKTYRVVGVGALSRV